MSVNSIIRTPYALLLFLIPLAVALIGQLLFFHFSDSKVDILTDGDVYILSKYLIHYTKEAGFSAHGYLYATSLLALIVASVGAVATSVLIVLQENETRSRPRRRFFVIPVLFSGLIFLTMTSYGDAESTVDFLGDQVFELAVVLHWAKMGLPFTLASWIDFANALGISGAVFIAICVCAIAPKAPPMIRTRTVDETDLNEDEKKKLSAQIAIAVDDLEARTRWLKYLLFGAASILIAAVANMQAWRGWPNVVLDAVNADTGKAYKLLADASITYHSFLFVMILIAIFMPMAVWMQQNARILSESAKALGLIQMKTPAMWRQENGLALSFSENMQRILAVISPILVGPLFELAKGGLNF
jgi:hypothetical protein